MPYRLSGNCVQKETASGWETVKCHENTRKAQAHLNALNINVMTDEEKSGLFTRFLEWAKGLTQPDPAPLEANGFKVTGNRWFAWWSNNFEDRDGEIFTEASIDDYVGRVKSGVTPYPELWFWHIPGTKHGQADYVGRVGHFAVAAGEFDNTPLAQSMKAHYSKGEWAVSHGFRYPPSQKQHGVYHHFTTFELSPLRPQAAANPYTEFNEVVKMQSPEQAVAELKTALQGNEALALQIITEANERGKKVAEDTRYKSAAERSEEAVNADLAEVKAQLDTLLKARQQEAETSEREKATNDRLASIEKTQADIARAMKQLTQLVAAEFEAQPPASKSKLTQVDAEDAAVKEMMEAAKAAGKRKMSVLEKMTGAFGGDDDDEEDSMMPRRGGKR